MKQGTCKHYNGIMHEICDAGVNYNKQFGSQPGVLLRLPCIQFEVRPQGKKGTYIGLDDIPVRNEFDRRGQQEGSCDKLQLPTDAEIRADQEDAAARMDRLKLALSAASAWRTKGRPTHSRAETITCPACGGKLHLSQLSYNGHVHGRCETPGCVSWME